MEQQRIYQHPILDPKPGKPITFYFCDQKLTAHSGEVIASALFANGIHCFGHHYKDQAPQGIFCANGQCAQCLVVADGKPVKSCITPIRANMKVEPIEGLPPLPIDDSTAIAAEVPEIDIDVLVVGGGPAGLSAAIELARYQVSIIIADDKQILGGKLALQTHNFFGSTRDCYAGTRGIDIGTRLAHEIEQFANISIWLESPVVGAFVDGKVGIVRQGIYYLIRPKVLLVAAGARERNLIFPGCDLPGVYGAGAFQTLVNRDLIKAAQRLFIIGGGNVGLIAAYHALQAGIEVVGLAEALPKCGGYQVHVDKIKRLGVPIYLSHTVLYAQGHEHVEEIGLAQVDANFCPQPGTEKFFKVDTLLIAVGLAPVNELLIKANLYGIPAFGAGDADIVAEASAAMFSGKITARKILLELGSNAAAPEEWKSIVTLLRSRPGAIHPQPQPAGERLIYPGIFCTQEIPCNPCTDVCPLQSIYTHDGTLTGIPLFNGDCIGCGRCVAICPGLAVTLIDKRYDPSGQKALVTLPWEMNDEVLHPGAEVTITDIAGADLGSARVIAIKNSPWQDRRRFLLLEVPGDQADHTAGIRISGATGKATDSTTASVSFQNDENIVVCRCQRISKKEVLAEIEKGEHDINSIKATLGCCMGPCGGKTCEELILRIFREKGIATGEVTRHVVRPFDQEIPLQSFLGRK